MCGIVGIVGNSEVAQRLFDGLKRLEYRGYDSAGICTIDHGELERRRAEGKLDNLARELSREPLGGTIGIVGMGAMLVWSAVRHTRTLYNAERLP